MLCVLYRFPCFSILERYWHHVKLKNSKGSANPLPAPLAFDLKKEKQKAKILLKRTVQKVNKSIFLTKN